MTELDTRVKELLLKYEGVREGLSLYLCKYNLFVAGLFEQVRHTFDHIARCYVLYQISGQSPNKNEINKNIERANNHLERLGLDILKSLMFAESEYFGIFVKSYKENLQTMIKEQTTTTTNEMINFLTACDETRSEIEKCIIEARKSECTAKSIITKGETYENAYRKICDKVNEVTTQYPAFIEHRQRNKQVSKVIEKDIDDKTTTLREICEFYWKSIKNDISWREIKRNEFDANGLLLLVETLDYIAWYAMKGKGLGNAKKKLLELQIEIHRSLLRSAKKDFDTMFDVIEAVTSIDEQFLNIKNYFCHRKQSIQNKIDEIENDNVYDKILTRLRNCYELICKANKECLSVYRKYKSENALHNINFPIL